MKKQKDYDDIDIALSEVYFRGENKNKPEEEKVKCIFIVVWHAIFKDFSYSSLV